MAETPYNVVKTKDNARLQCNTRHVTNKTSVMRAKPQLMSCKQSSFSISLAPYCGRLIVAKDVHAYERVYNRLSGSTRKIDQTQCGECSSHVDAKGRFRLVIYAINMPSLIHELSHGVFFLFDHCGVEASNTHTEPFCYMIDHLFGQIVKRGKIKLP